MEYRDLLSRFSQSIFALSKDEDQTEEILVDAASMNIYRKNLFVLMVKSIGDDYEVVREYLGESNFRFLIREFIVSGFVSSPNMERVSHGFVEFLERSEEIHQDELVVELAKLDRLWSGVGKDPEEVPLGLTQYWLALSENKDTAGLMIDLDTREIVQVEVREGEKYLKLDRSRD